MTLFVLQSLREKVVEEKVFRDETKVRLFPEIGGRVGVGQRLSWCEVN